MSMPGIGQNPGGTEPTGGTPSHAVLLILVCAVMLSGCSLLKTATSVPDPGSGSPGLGDSYTVVREWDFSETPLPFREDAESVVVVIDGKERYAARVTSKGDRNDLALFPPEGDRPVVTEGMALLVEYHVEADAPVSYTMVYVYTADGRIGQERDQGTPLGEWVRAVYPLEELRVAPHAGNQVPIAPGNEITRLQIFVSHGGDDIESTLTLARLALVVPNDYQKRHIEKLTREQKKS